MGKEYIIAAYSGDPRDVLSGGNDIGVTNTLLTIETGNHTLTLDGPADYTSEPMPVMVADTSIAYPMTIQFTPIAPPGTAMLARAVAARPPKPRRKAPAARKASKARGKPKRKPKRRG